MNMQDKYLEIFKMMFSHGVLRNDRTGIGCYSLFNMYLSFDLSKGKFPQMTHRHISEKVHKAEFDWILSGQTNIKPLQEKGIKIWDLWADEAGDLGPVYGYQIRNFNGEGIDQLKNLLEGLKTNPDSRRHIISLWNPAQTAEMALPPCYPYFQFFVENNNLNLFVVQRSADWLVGVPYDICLYSRLLIYVASQVGLQAQHLDMNFIDAHAYVNHQEFEDKFNSDIEFPDYHLNEENEIIISNYKHGGKIRPAINV